MIDFTFTSEEEAFRAEVRALIRANLPEATRRWVALEKADLPRDMQAEWQGIMAGLGWGGQGLPVEAGGPGWTDAQYFIFSEEIGRADAPRPMLYGLRMVAHTLVEFGTPDQKARFLPGILAGTDFWCQGFSEPGAGSDLAALSCKADLAGDHYTLNGQKIWITEAHHADWMFGLFRTARMERRQQGITCLAVDLRAPGVRIRPLPLYDGTHECNEVFFENVRVPVANRIHAHNEGWSVAKFLLGVERFDTAEVPRSRAAVERIKLLARATGRAHDPLFRARLAALEVELDALAATELRYVLGEAAKIVGPAASLLKFRGTEIQQDILELLMDLHGDAAQLRLSEDELADGPEGAYAGRAFHRFRVTSIYAGSNEVQRNIIAKAVLGLG